MRPGPRQQPDGWFEGEEPETLTNRLPAWNHLVFSVWRWEGTEGFDRVEGVHGPRHPRGHSQLSDSVGARLGSRYKAWTGT